MSACYRFLLQRADDPVVNVVVLFLEGNSDFHKVNKTIKNLFIPDACTSFIKMNGIFKENYALKCQLLLKRSILGVSPTFEGNL